MLFSRGKASSHECLIRSFQLAFSLRSVALGEDGSLPPSRRRSLFTLATAMIMFSAKAFNVAPLVPIAKLAVNQKTADPFLQFGESCKLQAVKTPPKGIEYGSPEDDNCAVKSLQAVELTETQTKESMVSLILNSLQDVPEAEKSTMRTQLLNKFLPDDVCPLGPQMGVLPGQSLAIVPFKTGKDEAITQDSLIDDDIFTEPHGTQAQTCLNLQDDLLSVNELLETVLETAHQVGRFSVSTTPDVPFSHCEARLLGKQEKMSNFMNTQQKQGGNPFSRLPEDLEEEKQTSLFNVNQTHRIGNPFVDDNFSGCGPRPSDASNCHSQFMKLPAASPYDNFLKAAGC